MGPWRHPRPAPGTVMTGETEQVLHAVAVAPVGLEQLGEPVVVDRGPGQRPADVLGHVVVAERDGVRVAERALGDLRRGPDPDAGKGTQSTVRLGDRHGRTLLEAAGIARGSHDGPRARAV